MVIVKEISTTPSPPVSRQPKFAPHYNSPPFLVALSPLALYPVLAQKLGGFSRFGFWVCGSSECGLLSPYLSLSLSLSSGSADAGGDVRLRPGTPLSFVHVPSMVAPSENPAGDNLETPLRQHIELLTSSAPPPLRCQLPTRQDLTLK